MKLTAMDTETFPIKPGLLAPRIVCFSWGQRLHPVYGKYDAIQSDKIDLHLELRDHGLLRLARLLGDSTQHLTIHNAPFDLACAAADMPQLVPLIFDAYADGRIHCTVSRQKIIDVAAGMRKWRRVRGQVKPATYSLADLVELYFQERLEKVDTWRVKYGLLDGVPVSEWPKEAVEYAESDASWHLKLWEAQDAEMCEMIGEPLPNLKETAQSAWALHLMSCWGIRADPAAVEKFVDTCQHEIAKMHDELADTGIFREPDKQGKRSRVMAEIRRRVEATCAKQGRPVPTTPTGQTQTDKETLENSEDPALQVLAESMSFEKHLGQWGPVLLEATTRPVCCRYNELVETGRTSCSAQSNGDGTNIQNPPRKGDVRPAIVPRRGWVFVSTDADTIELRAHAQNCLELVGWSDMADALLDQHKNKGPDLHIRMGASILEIDPYEALERMRAGDEEIADARQFGKIPNFGFPGGLGAEAFVTYAAGQMSRKRFLKWFGSNWDDQVAFARDVRAKWFETYRENRDYFRLCGDMVDEDTREGTIRQLMSGRVRGGARFTAIANGFFQGRVADAMKEVLFQLARECYADETSVLFGSRPVMFLHDEPIVEHPDDETLTYRAERQQQIVVEVLNKWMPRIPCTSKAVATRRWYKGADPVYVDGKLVCSRPEYWLNGERVEKLPTKIDEDKDKVKTKWVEDRRSA